MHANPGIDERVQSFWCNLRLDAKLETIKWPFLDEIVEVMNIINSRGAGV